MLFCALARRAKTRLRHRCHAAREDPWRQLDLPAAEATGRHLEVTRRATSRRARRFVQPPWTPRVARALLYALAMTTIDRDALAGVTGGGQGLDQILGMFQQGLGSASTILAGIQQLFQGFQGFAQLFGQQGQGQGGQPQAEAAQEAPQADAQQA
jgi:hypothetical protein